VGTLIRLSQVVGSHVGIESDPKSKVLRAVDTRKGLSIHVRSHVPQPGTLSLKDLLAFPTFK